MIYSLKNKEKKYFKKEDVKEITDELKENLLLVKELDLKSNIFCPAPMKELCSYIQKMDNLESIILDGIFTTLNKEDMLNCFRMLCTALVGKRLVLFDISNNALSAELPEEFQTMLSNCNDLKFLKMRNCGLGLIGADCIGKCFMALENKDSLEYLDLAQNRFFSFPKHLSEGIMSLRNLSILRLEYNTIEKESMGDFLRMLKSHPLEVLDIRDNFLDVSGCKALGEIFATWNLKELLAGDCLMRNEGVTEFIKYASKKVVSLNLPGDISIKNSDVTIDISYNEFEQECIDLLVEFVKTYSISKLCINGNLYDDCDELVNIMERYGGIIVTEDEEEQTTNEDIDESLIEMIGKL